MPKLQVGDPAPEFLATSHTGEELRLSDFRGKSAVVLFFYPKDGTPVCTKEACAFRDSYERFAEQGVAVIGVSSDSQQRHRSFAEQHGLPFHLVSDPGGSLRKAFGVPRTLGLIPGRVTFAIDAEGAIRLVFSAQFASEEHVRQALKALQNPK